MKLLRNLFSGLITFFLVPLLITYLVVSGIFGVLLNQTAFEETLNKNNTYSRLATKIVPPLIINLASKNEDQEFIPSETLENIISKVDKNVLATDLEKVINDIYKYVTTNQQNFETKIGLETYTTVIKDNLKPALINYYESLPACTAAEEKSFENNFSAEIKCKSNKISSTKFVQLLEVDGVIEELKNNFPTTLIITEKKISTFPQTNILQDDTLNTKPKTTPEPILINIQKALKVYKSSEKLLIMIVISLIFLLVISRLKNISSSCKWVASAFFSASFLPLGMATLLLYFIKADFFQNTLIRYFGFNYSDSLQKESIALISDNLFTFSQKILQSIQFKSFLVIVIAIVLYGIFLILKYLDKHKANKPLDAVSKSTHNIG